VAPSAGQRGAISADYIAVLVLAGALVAALFAIGIPRVVGDWGTYASCALFAGDDEGCERPHAHDHDDGGDTTPDRVDPDGRGAPGERPSTAPDLAVPPRHTGLTDFLADVPPGTLTADDYLDLAVEYVRSLLPEEDPDNIYARNRAITQAYAELYFLDPQLYKWAGMAAFASDLVGDGIRQAEAARQHGGPPIPGVNDFSFTRLSQLLQLGNALVFTDIYWQHLAYHHGGIDAVRRAHDDGKLPSNVYEGWLQIDAGRRQGNADLIWDGNERLLDYEQRVTLQEGVYDQGRKIFQRLSSGPIRLLQPMTSPIPGHDVTFQQHVPGGDLGDFDSRWAGISESMLPAWRERESQLTDDLWRFVR
jgi:hypothetical protein